MLLVLPVFCTVSPLVPPSLRRDRRLSSDSAAIFQIFFSAFLSLPFGVCSCLESNPSQTTFALPLCFRFTISREIRTPGFRFFLIGFLNMVLLFLSLTLRLVAWFPVDERFTVFFSPPVLPLTWISFVYPGLSFSRMVVS